MNILIRADSSSYIGTGHIMRDLVLAKQYPNQNIIFATQNLDGNINYKIIEAGYRIELLESNDFEELNEIIKFSQGNIYFMSIGKNIGYEIYGKKESFLRPVLVYKKLSNETFLGIPLSSKQKIGNYYFTFQYSDKTSSTALLNQMKIFDIRRSAYYDGYINVKDFAKLREQVKEFVDITPNRKGKGNGHASKKLPKDSKILSKKDKDVK